MDQPPAGSSATAPVQTNGTNPSVVRRVVRAPPALFKKANKKPQPIRPRSPAVAGAQLNGTRSNSPFVHDSSPLVPSNQSDSVSGFSDPKVNNGGVKYTDYKLVTTKRDLLRGLRYHLIHFSDKDSIDIRDEQAFPKPAHLHRRDPRSKAPEPVKDENDEPKDGLTAEQRVQHQQAREQRQKEREANLAQVAPSVAVGKKVVRGKKTQQVYRPNFTEEQKQTIQNNYEEKLPWHLEDWEGKRTFIGQNQVGSARKHVAFSFDASSGRYRMIPVEKVYRFEPPKEEIKYRNELTLEEAEQIMRKKKKVPGMIARHEEAQLQEKRKRLEEKMSSGLYTGGHSMIYASRGGEDADLDFEDDFADDEEGDIFEEKDEDEKLQEKKIKEDQLQANFLDFKDTRDVDVLEQQEEKEEEARKKNFIKVRKALAKREGNYNQGSDSEDESETDTEEERKRVEAEKLNNVKKEEDAADGKTSRVPSGANTPSGRKDKPGTASDREKRPLSKKRPGSPNMSDASGTDASVARKKKKTKHVSSSQPTPGPSRPMSPDSASLDPSSAATRPINRRASSQGKGSDTDGGAMSDGTRRLKVNLKVKQRGPSPPTSRPSSPPPPAAPKPISTAEEARALIPSGGITSKEFMARAGIAQREHFARLMPLIKSVARFEGGKIFPKAVGNAAMDVKKEPTAVTGVKKEGGD